MHRAEDTLLFDIFLKTVFCSKFDVVWQEAKVNSPNSEMGEILRAMSAENERLLSATDSSQRRQHSSVSYHNTASVTCCNIQFLMLSCNCDGNIISNLSSHNRLAQYWCGCVLKKDEDNLVKKVSGLRSEAIKNLDAAKVTQKLVLVLILMYQLSL